MEPVAELVLLFPGQGSQYCGMEKLPNLLHAAHDPTFPETYWQQVDAELCNSLSSLIKNGPLEQLTLTENAQPALLSISHLYFLYLKNILAASFPHLKIKCVLGHSLGEFSAFLSANVFEFNLALKLTQYRGKVMQESAPTGLGSMTAILRVPYQIVEQACQAVSQPEQIVAPANINSADQVVISGHTDACRAVVAWLETNFTERFRALPLNVSAPFHSQLMNPGKEKLAQFIQNSATLFHANKIPYIANLNATLYPAGTSPQVLQQNLIEQITAPVQWLKSLSNLAKISDRVKFIEVGPGQVLTGLNKKVLPQFKCWSMDQTNNIDQISEKNYREELTRFIQS